VEVNMSKNSQKAPRTLSAPPGILAHLLSAAESVRLGSYAKLKPLTLQIGGDEWSVSAPDDLPGGWALVSFRPGARTEVERGLRLAEIEKEIASLRVYAEMRPFQNAENRVAQKAQAQERGRELEKEREALEREAAAAAKLGPQAVLVDLREWAVGLATVVLPEDKAEPRKEATDVQE
jgi:hypothetical protein